MRPKIRNYVEDVVNNYTEIEFRENFRMGKRTFDYVLMLIKDKISTSGVDNGRQTIDGKTQLLITLWYLATPDSYR